MLVTTATMGERRRNVPSLSSASATRNSPCPRRAFVPSARSLPPTTMVGSRPASRRTAATSEVVVVFPWDPAPAPVHRRITLAGQPEPPTPVPDPAPEPDHAPPTYRSPVRSSSSCYAGGAFSFSQTRLGDAHGGVGTPEGACPRRDRGASLAVAEQRAERGGEACPGQLGIEDHLRGAGPGEDLGVAPLVVVGRVRVGHEA